MKYNLMQRIIENEKNGSEKQKGIKPIMQLNQREGGVYVKKSFK